jgi:hypothetical protein
VGNIEHPETPVFVGFDEIPGLSTDEAALFQVTFSDRAASLVDGVDRWRTSQTRIGSKGRLKEKSGIKVGLGVYLMTQQPDSGATSFGPPNHSKSTQRTKR